MTASPWETYVPSDAEPWNLRRVVHLHRRAGFAATWGELQRDLESGPEDALERVLGGQSRRDGVPEDFDQMADLIGNATTGNPERLKAWWVYRMLLSPDPLAERLTLLWHNHFATSNLKVDDVRLMHEQNETFRRFGRGPFGELLRRAVKHPAMLLWLDAEVNRQEHPNENLARELMELFTLGEGNFTERDVHEAARALAGWTVSRREFRFAEAYHDGGSKTILGRSGTFTGDSLLDILLEHPAAARRLAWRLCTEFMGEACVSESALDELAVGLREHELDIGWAVKTILRSRVFFADQNIGTRVLGPAEFVVGVIRMLEAFAPPPSTLLLAERIARLGQDLFYPPNVFGWPGGRGWINTQSIIGRGNFAAALLNGSLHGPIQPSDYGTNSAVGRPIPLDVAGLAQRHGSGPSAAEVVRWISQLVTGGEPTAPLEAIVSGTSGLQRIVAVFLASPDAQLG